MEWTKLIKAENIKYVIQTGSGDSKQKEFDTYEEAVKFKKNYEKRKNVTLGNIYKKVKDNDKIKLVKAEEEYTEEQKQAYLAEEQKANQLAFEYGYKAIISYDLKNKELFSIRLESNGEKLKPEIYIDIKSVVGKPGVRIQTTAYGSLGLKDYVDFARNVQIAYSCAKAFEENYLNK